MAAQCCLSLEKTISFDPLMLTQDRWLLPEGIEDVFPDEAERLQHLGRTLTQLFRRWGYRLVMPPPVDFLDSLLVGTGHALDLKTFKLTDPISGRLMGLRADMTPQVARIDARTAKAQVPQRLCYTGAVLHTLSGHLEVSRNPLQIGAELYGSSGNAAALEVIRLMLEMLEAAGVEKTHLDLGHVGIYRNLAAMAQLDADQEDRLFEILQRKDPTDLHAFLEGAKVKGPVADMIAALLDLNGPGDILKEAQERLLEGGSSIRAALDELIAISTYLKKAHPELPVNLDLAELRGYEYHTGIVFAAFVPGQGREIARGGRYDDIGKVFGPARPAVGFSSDLKTLARLACVDPHSEELGAIFAPCMDDMALNDMVARLRAEGEVVIEALDNAPIRPEDLGCTRILEKQAQDWKVLELRTR